MIICLPHSAAAGAVYLVWLVVGAPAGYAISCWIWPWRYCLCCEGTGRHTRDDGRVWRECRWCGGRGRTLRLGRQVWRRVRGGR